jgi:uncharacterized membrane protein
MTITEHVARPRTVAATQRIASIDVVRGAVMVLMAIDHVRVYSGVPAGGPSPGIFFTRWVTHFCAPAFVFFAGTAAFLHGRALGNTRLLSRYLATRGLLLVALELTIIHLSWTFSLPSMTSQLAGVIWMLGWCMVLMAALIHLDVRAVAVFGVAVMAGQDLINLIPPALLTPEWFWQFLYRGGEVAFGPISFSVLYTIVPWIGVMAAGYGFGLVMTRDERERRRLCLRIGFGATALFLALGITAVFLSPPADDAPPVLFRILNQRKYPASQLFLLMTLGPAIVMLPFVERASNWFTRTLAVFGRVPMFYYLLHIPLIHATALLVWLARDGAAGAERFNFAPYVDIPPDERWSLALLYLVFAAVVFMLYFPCRWYAGLKARHRTGLLRYI